jgi:Na+-transporting methylmalonyl-CoA/oxaloacetate decarboxylase gamma subunit
MTITDALLYSLAGMLVVFFALVLLMCIILVMRAISDRSGRGVAPAAEEEPVPVEAPAPAPAPAPVLAPGSAGCLKLYDTDPRTAATLMAIVADELQAPLNQLRFLSIREVKEDTEDEV